MRALLFALDLALQLYWWVLIVSAVASWLVAFNVVNMRNDVIRSIMTMLYNATEPVLAPIRRRLPNFGGLDLSPIVVLMIIFVLRYWIGQLVDVVPF